MNSSTRKGYGLGRARHSVTWTVLLGLVLSASIPKATPFKRVGAWTQELTAGSRRFAQKATRSSPRKVQEPCVLRCAAVALAYSVDSSVCEGGEYDDLTASSAVITPLYVGNITSSSGDSGSSSGSRSTTRQASGGTTPIIAGDIVLSDWLDELPSVERSRPGPTELVLALSSRGREVRRAGQGDSSTGVGSSEGDGDSAPVRFQQLIQHMWNELNQNDQLAYLGSEGQTRVKGALTVLGAYGALREHPLQADISSPQQAFSEMDFNRDGEVSFDEFVRWYSMSSAIQQERRQQQQSPPPPPPPMSPANQPADANFGMDTVVAPPSPAPLSNDGASRLMADLEGLVRTSRPRGSNEGAAPGKQPLLPPQMPGGSSVPQRPLGTVDARSCDGGGRRLPAGAAAAATDTGGGEFPVVLAPTAVSSWLVKEASGRRLATEAEKDAFREQWLAGGTVDEASASLPDSSKKADGPGAKAGFSNGSGGRSTAEEDLEKALQVLSLLVKASADADTLIAALASRMIRNPTGRYNLEVIEEQFGPSIRGIVEDRLLLERLPEPISAASYVAIQQSRGVKAVLDLDNNHAKLMREYLVHASKDARAVVVHMADLTCRLREMTTIPEYARHSMALEALQLYVPVSNALGLGSSFRELEELGYKTLFPQTYATIGRWHRDVRQQSHDIVLDVKERMLHALQSRKHIAERVHRYRIDGRTKGLVSTFRKVFRQNKRATDVHDMIGLRIIVEPRSDGIYGARHSATSEYMDSAAGGNAQNSPEVGINASCGVPLATVAEAAPVEDSVCADIEVARRGSYERGLYNESPGSGRGRSGGGYKDARGRNGVGVASERGEGTGSVDIVGVAEGSDDVRSSEEGERREESKSKGKYRARSEKAELSAFTFKSFPPPYRDADSRLLHDVFEVLVGLFEEVPGRYKNYVDFPKPNGYRSIHTTVLHPTTLMMELQVRTARMHSEAEGGAAAHSLYKGDLNNPDEASLFRSKMTPPDSPARAAAAADTLKLLSTTKAGACGDRVVGEGKTLENGGIGPEVQSNSGPNADEP